MKSTSMFTRLLAMLLSFCLLLSTVSVALAAEITDNATNDAEQSEDLTPELPTVFAEESAESDAEVSDYATFLADLKQLETYAQAYAAENTNENANALVINYIRTGVERYTSGTWQQMAGAENAAFVTYIKEQDSANGTSVSDLRNLGEIILPNGNKVDLGHTFGTMDITYYAVQQGMTYTVIQARADLGGWAGDIADMMYCAVNADISDKVDLSETDVELLANAIKARYLGADYGTLNEVDHSFTSTDLYGDLDAIYILDKVNGGESISAAIENYFTNSLSDKDRASFFLQNRLGRVQTKAAIRTAVLNIYQGNTLLEALEASYSLTDLPEHERLQKACCYAFADFLFGLAGDDSGTDPVDPVDPVGPVDPDAPENNYYSVFSSTISDLAPGITQTIKYAMTK